jgi:hypothetical protein
MKMVIAFVAGIVFFMLLVGRDDLQRACEDADRAAQDSAQEVK